MPDAPRLPAIDPATLPERLGNAYPAEHTASFLAFHLSQAATLGGKHLSLIQYRKSLGGSAAFYQAAIEYRPEAVRIYGGGFLPGSYILKFWDREGTYLNGLSLARDFGFLDEEARIAKYAIWVDCDYSLQPQSYLWLNENSAE